MLLAAKNNEPNLYLCHKRAVKISNKNNMHCFVRFIYLFFLFIFFLGGGGGG